MLSPSVFLGNNLVSIPKAARFWSLLLLSTKRNQGSMESDYYSTQAHFCCEFPREGGVEVTEAWDHQQVTFWHPGTQHPLFWPLPTQPGLVLSRGKPQRALLECGLGVGDRRGVEVIRAGGASPGQGCAPCTTRTPQGRALCVFCPRPQEMRGPTYL